MSSVKGVINKKTNIIEIPRGGHIEEIDDEFVLKLDCNDKIWSKWDYELIDIDLDDENLLDISSDEESWITLIHKPGDYLKENFSKMYVATKNKEYIFRHEGVSLSEDKKHLVARYLEVNQEKEITILDIEDDEMYINENIENYMTIIILREHISDKNNKYILKKQLYVYDCNNEEVKILDSNNIEIFD